MLMGEDAEHLSPHEYMHTPDTLSKARMQPCVRSGSHTRRISRRGSTATHVGHENESAESWIESDEDEEEQEEAEDEEDEKDEDEDVASEPVAGLAATAEVEDEDGNAFGADARRISSVLHIHTRIEST
jgi:hypothetical protein